MAEVPIEPELKIRYVAGFGKHADTGELEFYVVQLLEDAEGERYGNRFVIEGMDTAQLEHLHMQLGNALKIAKPSAPPESKVERCPQCRHAPHAGRVCLNMASDNDCSCKGERADD